MSQHDKAQRATAQAQPHGPHQRESAPIDPRPGTAEHACLVACRIEQDAESAHRILEHHLPDYDRVECATSHHPVFQKHYDRHPPIYPSPRTRAALVAGEAVARRAVHLPISSTEVIASFAKEARPFAVSWADSNVPKIATSEQLAIVNLYSAYEEAKTYGAVAYASPDRALAAQYLLCCGDDCGLEATIARSANLMHILEVVANMSVIYRDAVCKITSKLLASDLHSERQIEYILSTICYPALRRNKKTICAFERLARLLGDVTGTVLGGLTGRGAIH